MSIGNGKRYRQPAILLVLLLMLPLLGLAEPTENPERVRLLSEAQAVVLEKLALTPEELNLVSEFRDEANGYWTFVFTRKTDPSAAQMTVRLEPSGWLDLFVPPQSNTDAELEAALREELNQQIYRGPADMLALKDKWEGHFPQLARMRGDLLNKGQTLPWYLKSILFVQQDLRLPSAANLPLEQLQRLAKEKAAAATSMSAEKLAMYRVSTEVLYQSDELQLLVYQCIFEQQPMPEGEADFLTFEAEYLKPLIALFDGKENEVPSYISVRLDAKTGQLLEDVRLGLFEAGYLYPLELIR